MYEDLSDDEIVRSISEPVTSAFEISRTESYKAEMSRRLLNSNRILIQSIVKFNNSTKCYSNILVGLTAILAVLASIQIYSILCK